MPSVPNLFFACRVGGLSCERVHLLFFFLCSALHDFQFGLYLRKNCTVVNATDVKNKSNMFKITSLYVKVKLKKLDQSKLNFVYDYAPKKEKAMVIMISNKNYQGLLLTININRCS